MAMNPTTALPAVGSHHHAHHLHEGHGVGGPHHHGAPHHHPVSHNIHSEVSFEEFTNSMSPFLDYSTSLHLTAASSPYAAVSAAAAAAAASGMFPNRSWILIKIKSLINCKRRHFHQLLLFKYQS